MGSEYLFEPGIQGVELLLVFVECLIVRWSRHIEMTLDEFIVENRFKVSTVLPARQLRNFEELFGSVIRFCESLSSDAHAHFISNIRSSHAIGQAR
jgi:hypothetical protein